MTPLYLFQYTHPRSDEKSYCVVVILVSLVRLTMVLLHHLRQTIKSIYEQSFLKKYMTMHVTSIFRVLLSYLRGKNTFLEEIQDLWLAKTLR